MPRVTLYRLRPRGPMHFGAPGIGVEGVVPFPSAATFFSAWCWALLELADTLELERLLARFRDGDPPFVLAAPVPWIGEHLLLPRVSLPVTRGPEEALLAPSDKRGKRYRWVEETLWLRLLAGEAADAEFQDDQAFHQDQTIWAADRALRAETGTMALGNTDTNFWKTEIIPRVTVDRRTSSGEIYQLGTTWFRDGTDLALPVCWRDDAERDRLERALRVLGDAGIGGNRSAGYGQFDVKELVTRDWPDLGSSAEESAFVTLAGYHPTRAEVSAGVFDDPASYSLERSQGWVDRGWRKHSVRLVAVGSVLHRLPGQALYGELVDVTPAGWRHPVYRYGYAFPLPVRAVRRAKE